MSQIPLSLNLPPVYSEDNFFVSDCNREAWQWIMKWPAWPGHALLLYGPKGSGKTHLGQLWAQKANAKIWPAAGLDTLAASATPSSWLIESIEHTSDQRQLLHLFNIAREQGKNLLMTANTAAAQLPFTLPDLVSRLQATTAVPIHQPDDTVLAGAMRKQFADRQMKVGDDIIAYTLPRMERSLEKVRELVERIDESALAEHKSVTIPFIRKLIG
jgi:DnaA regulatory inactivator Hda